MNRSIHASAVSAQSATADRRNSDRSASADLDRWLAMLQRAMADTGWTPEALDAHWETSRGYAWRLVNGEKPWSVERLLSLPDDLEARFEHLRAESFGLIVVQPLFGEDARRALVAGLIGVLSSPALPVKTAGPIRAELRPDGKKAEAV